MIQGVGSIRYPGQSSTKGSSGAVQDQLAKVESQLAACLNCATSNTAAGRAKIQVLSARVQALKSRVEELQKGLGGGDQAARVTTAGTVFQNGPESSQGDATKLAQGGSHGGFQDLSLNASGGRLDLLA